MWPLRLALAPVLTARQAVADLATLAVFAREFGTWGPQFADRGERFLEIGAELQATGTAADRNARELIAVGEQNVRIGAEMLELARANIEGNRETNDAMRALDERMTELLRFAAVLEQELPAITDAAPPVQAAAERVERIAARIPGVRSG